MNEGPTTVGSIVGKLRMDRAQWVAMMAATKKDITELEAMDPEIHIDSNAAEVNAKLAATKAATDAVGASAGKAGAAQKPLTAAMNDTEVAAKRVQIAQMRLNELRDKGVTSGSRYATAELALSEAMRKANDQTVKANEVNKTSVGRAGAIAAAVGLLLPLLPPVAAGAAGIAGAMAGMGAAGVLAVLGVVKEMRDGTAVGAEYRAGVDSLTGSLGTLSHTSAATMLKYFQQAVRDTKDALPGLNTQVGQFSTLLGRSGVSLLGGVINVLRVLNPLFLTAGVYVQSLAQGFEQWTQSGGLEQFGGYALSTLPTVTELLGSLARMVLHILQALAPLGTVGMAVLGGISDLISSIPVDVLSQLIVTVTWGAIAFKAWGFIAPMLATVAEAMGAVGVATTVATGPIGWVVAALAAMAGIFAVVIAQNTGATRAMQDYTAAVQSDNGAIGENIRQKAAQRLLDSGALDIAKKLGIATSDVVDATLGDTDARKRLNAELGKGLLSTQQIMQAVKDNGQAISGEIDRYNVLKDAIGGTTTATAEQTAADQAAASALGISVSVVQQAEAAQKDNSNATATATAQMYLQNDAAGLLKQTLDLLNGKTLDAASAQNQFDSQLANMGSHIDKTGKDINRATADIDGMSSAAVANRGELINSVQAAEQAAQAFRDNGGSAADARQKLIDMKQAIVDHAVAVGEDRNKVQAFIDKIFQIPAKIPPTQIEVETAQAEAALAALTRTRTVFVQARYNATADAIQLGKMPGGANGTTGMAGGGTAYGLANGGGGTVMGPGNAASDTAGLYRLAHGEEVISNKFGQADRWRAQLKAINAGYTPTTVSARPVMPPATAPAGAGDVNLKVEVTGVQQTDPHTLGTIVGTRTARALAGLPGVNR